MKISIVTASYNSGDTLRDTIESVLRQTYSDIEYIIVDGASHDGTMDIVREYEPRFGGRLRWVSEPDSGIYDAMNKGLAMATGDVVGILNSDDFYTADDILARVAEAMADENTDAVYGDIHFVDGGNLGECVRYYSSRFFAPWMMLMGYQPAHPSFYCRREYYCRYGDFDTSMRVAADFEHMLRLIYVNRIRTRYLPLDFVTMRTGGASTNGLGSHRRIIADHHRAFAKHRLRMGYVLDFMRYPCKLAEVALYKLRSLFGRTAEID